MVRWAPHDNSPGHFVKVVVELRDLSVPTARPQLRQLAGDETATRLSYLLRGTMADERLRLLVELTQTDAFLYMAA